MGRPSLTLSRGALPALLFLLLAELVLLWFFWQGRARQHEGVERALARQHARFAEAGQEAATEAWLRGKAAQLQGRVLALEKAAAQGVIEPARAREAFIKALGSEGGEEPPEAVVLDGEGALVAASAPGGPLHRLALRQGASLVEAPEGALRRQWWSGASGEEQPMRLVLTDLGGWGWRLVVGGFEAEAPQLPLAPSAPPDGGWLGLVAALALHGLVLAGALLVYLRLREGSTERRLELTRAEGRAEGQAELEAAARRQADVERKLELRDRMLEKLEGTNRELSQFIEELRRSSHEIQLLNQMSDLLQACQSVEETDRIIVQLARDFFPRDAGALYRFSAVENLLERVSGWGAVEAFASDFPVEDCWALRRGKLHEIDEDSAELVCAHLGQAAPHGSLCLPLIAQGELLGLLHIQWGAADPSASEEARGAAREARKRLAATVTEQFALALANLKLREQLRDQSIRDQLTGLYNRRHMEESLSRELHRARRRETPLSLVMLDVDHFKRFNDTYGHEDGDLLLRELGALLASSVRQEDIACRYGGEEFLMILPEAPLDAAAERAELLRRRVSQNLKVKQQSVTISLGVAAWPDHGSGWEAVLGAADAALYQAKEGGRDRVVVYRGSA